MGGHVVGCPNIFDNICKGNHLFKDLVSKQVQKHGWRKFQSALEEHHKQYSRGTFTKEIHEMQFVVAMALKLEIHSGCWSPPFHSNCV